MKLFIPKETQLGETRVALVPDSARKLIDLGLAVNVEKNAGATSEYWDVDYENAGADTVTDREEAFRSAEVVLRVRKPDLDEIEQMQSGALHISFLDPFQEIETIRAFARARVSAVSMEMMPRTTLAQKMDALSSQANLAGYAAVITAAERLHRILPMMMTPAGTIAPARVFIVGVGVAGLQAIATAKRLGARVEAFDTRPAVEEQVRSLGARFLKIDLGETRQTEQGYAMELSEEQLQIQRKGMEEVCARSNIVITTARLFGRTSPIILTAEMVAAMAPGSIIVDLAVESGGNVEGSRLDHEVLTDNGVLLLGIGNLEGKVSHHASQVYSSNLANFIEHFWDAESRRFTLDLEDELLSGCVITHKGQIVHERFKDRA